MDMQFDSIGSLHWLWVVLALALLMVYALKSAHRKLRRFATENLVDRITVQRSQQRRIVRMALLLLALVALVAAMLDPRWGTRYEEVRQRGIDIVVALDVSRSMLAEDVKPNRLERAKQYVRDLVEQLNGDRVGLITFAGTASTKCPLTVDYGAYRLALEEVGPESAARGGSLLGDAIRLTGEAFTDEVKDYKALVIFSDAEDHGSYPLEAAQRLKDELGVRIFTVGIGDDEEGARIPIIERGRRVYLTYEGEEVWSKLNGQILRDIALAGDGAYVPAGTRNVEMGRVYDQHIAPATKREYESAHLVLRQAQYQWFAGLALFLLLVESSISERRSAARAADRMEVVPA